MRKHDVPEQSYGCARQPDLQGTQKQLSTWLARDRNMFSNVFWGHAGYWIPLYEENLDLILSSTRNQFLKHTARNMPKISENSSWFRRCNWGKTEVAIFETSAGLQGMHYRPNKVHHDEGMIKAASFDNDPDSIEIVMPCTNTLNSNIAYMWKAGVWCFNTLLKAIYKISAPV